MSEQNPNDSSRTENEIGDEIRALGKNLEDIVRSFWQSEERQRIQKEVSESLTEVSDNLRKAVDEFSQSEPGQRLKSDFQDIQHRVESGEFQEKSRSEFLSVLQKINSELAQASSKMKDQPEDAAGEKSAD
jgi:hypothetical protein